MRAFVFTLDTIMALLIFMVVLSFTVIYIVEPVRQRSLYLYQVSADAIAVADEKGALIRLVDAQSDDQIRALLRSVPSTVCVQVRLINQSGGETVVSDPSCSSYNRELQNFWLPLHHEGKNYIVRWEAWYR